MRKITYRYSQREDIVFHFYVKKKKSNFKARTLWFAPLKKKFQVSYFASMSAILGLASALSAKRPLDAWRLLFPWNTGTILSHLFWQAIRFVAPLSMSPSWRNMAAASAPVPPYPVPLADNLVRPLPSPPSFSGFSSANTNIHTLPDLGMKCGGKKSCYFHDFLPGIKVSACSIPHNKSGSEWMDGCGAGQPGQLFWLRDRKASIRDERS